MMAGIVQNPYLINPVKNTSAALDRRDVVLNRMAELKLITPEQAQQAKKVGFDPKKVRPTRNGCVGTRYPFLCDYVKKSLLKTPSLGKTREEREDLILRGGLTVRTKIDPKSQELAQRNVSKVVGPTDPVISTMNMMEPGTGLIVAMAQSRPVKGYNVKEGETDWNLSVEPEMGGAQGYQAGSTFSCSPWRPPCRRASRSTRRSTRAPPWRSAGGPTRPAPARRRSAASTPSATRPGAAPRST